MDKYTKMSLDEVIVSSHPDVIEQAQKGDVTAARTLMSDAAICIQHGIALPEPLASYIGKALYNSGRFPKTISGEFNLKRNRGGNKYDGTYHDYLICLEVRIAAEDVGRYNNTTAGEGAYQAVADKYGDNVTHIRNLFEKNYKKWKIKDIPRSEVEALLPFYRNEFRKPSDPF